MHAPWDQDDTRELLKGAAAAAIGALVTGLVQWGVEALRERVREQRAKSTEPAQTSRPESGTSSFPDSKSGRS